MIFVLQFKRLFRKASLSVMLLTCAACIILCGTIREDNGLPECGFVSGSDSTAAEIANDLENDGLIRYDSESALRHAIMRGEVACGMVFPDDFTARVQSTKLDDAILFLESENVIFSEIYKYRATAYIIEHYTPHLVSKLLKKEGVILSAEDAEIGIDEYLTWETEFNFTYEDALGAPLKADHYSKRLVMGALSLLLFFAFSIFAVPYTEKQFLPIARRVGAKKALLAYAAPSVAGIIILFFGAAAVALALSGYGDLIAPAAVYILFLSALGIAATGIFGSTEKLRVPIIAICLLSLAVCPIFINISELLNIPMWLCHAVPTYFFYTACENTAACACIAVAMLVSACTFYAARVTNSSRFHHKKADA